jgi:hypothetical protein
VAKLLINSFSEGWQWTKSSIGRELFEPLPDDELDRWEQSRVRLLLDTHTFI